MRFKPGTVHYVDEVIPNEEDGYFREDVFRKDRKDRFYIDLLVEIWDDVDSIFGVNTRDTDGWVTVYVHYFGPQSLEVVVYIEEDDSCKQLLFVPTKEERDFFEELVHETLGYCRITFEELKKKYMNYK